MSTLHDRGTPEYLEQVEAALCLAYTGLTILCAEEAMTDGNVSEATGRALLVIRDLAPLVGRIMQRAHDGEAPER